MRTIDTVSCRGGLKSSLLEEASSCVTTIGQALPIIPKVPEGNGIFSEMSSHSISRDRDSISGSSAGSLSTIVPI